MYGTECEPELCERVTAIPRADGNFQPSIYIHYLPFYAESSLTTALSVRPGDMKTNVSESLLPLRQYISFTKY